MVERAHGDLSETLAYCTYIRIIYIYTYATIYIHIYISYIYICNIYIYNSGGGYSLENGGSNHYPIQSGGPHSLIDFILDDFM